MFIKSSIYHHYNIFTLENYLYNTKCRAIVVNLNHLVVANLVVASHHIVSMIKNLVVLDVMMGLLQLCIMVRKEDVILDLEGKSTIFNK